jgi:2-oxoisovalerate dehydrogenase E1 component
VRAEAVEIGKLDERLLFRMQLIRDTEETLLTLFSEGRLSGTTHTSIGQEAIAAALGEHVLPGDVVFSSHRGHGHYLACGGSPVHLFTELMGRDSELCGGRGGSQYLHARGFFTSGIQGGVPGNATGIALAQSLTPGEGGVTVAILGDGTMGEGLLYESLNFAALRSLPILFLVEHNGYAQSTPTHMQLAGTIVGRAEAFGIAAHELESNDAVELHEVLGRRLDEVRGKGRPALQVVRTYRLSPHSKGDDDRDPSEIEAWRARDPLRILGSRLGPERVQELREQAHRAVACAVQEAEAVPYASPAAARPLRLVPEGAHAVPWPRDEPEMAVKSLNRALHRLLESDERAFVIGEDILDPYGGAFKVTRGLSTGFPERVIPTPISEAGIVAWSTGAALSGRRPIAEIMFGDFVTLAADQLVNHAAKYRWVYGGDVSVPLVVRVPMGGGRGYGPTHSQSLEGLLLGVPGLVVVATSPLLDPGELLSRAASLDDPVLFIENKLLYAQPLMPQRDGRLGAYFVRADDSYFPTVFVSLTDFDDPDVLLVAYGGQVTAALEAMLTLLVEHEIACELVVPHVLAPAPGEALVQRAGAARAVAVVEEGPAAAGFGAEVAALVAAAPAPRRVLRVSGPNSPIPSSKPLEAGLLPSPARIVDAVLST